MHPASSSSSSSPSSSSPFLLSPLSFLYSLNGELRDSASFDSSRVFFLASLWLFPLSGIGVGGGGGGGGDDSDLVSMDLSKVGEKILNSVRSARSLGLLPSTSDRPEVPARAAAAATVARLLATLPPDQRESLSSSSAELSSMYGSKPNGPTVEALEEEFYEEVQNLLLDYGVETVADTLVEGLSRIKKCTDEGRALMSLDLQVLINGLQHFVPKDVKPKFQIVETFIKAYYLPETEYVHWACAHPEYSKSQIVGLVNLAATMKGWKRKTRLETLQKIE